MNDITAEVLGSLRDLGATHIWYTGVIEHSHCTDYSAYGITPDNPHVVKGRAGSPYAIKDYYDIDPDIAVSVPDRIAELEALVKRTHDAGMKVIIDFVPNHVSRQYHSDARPEGVTDFGADDDTGYFFRPDNNFYYLPHQIFAPSIPLGEGDDTYYEYPAKASGNDCFTAFPSQYDWYETVKLNYGIDYGDGTRHFNPIPRTWHQMLDILLYWAGKGVDGFRCDMAHMVPAEFWRWAIAKVKEAHPGIIFIAELYDTNIYRQYIDAGFDYLYDKVNLYDTLRAIQCSGAWAADITRCWQTVDGIGGNMLNFLENHDEQRFGSRFYAGDAAQVTPSLVVSAMIGTGPFMVYAGQELGEEALDAEGYSGEDGRTTIFDYWSIPTLRRWLSSGKPSEKRLTLRERRLRRLYRKVMRLCNDERAIASGRFFDVMYVNYDNPTVNAHRHYIWLRSDNDSTLIIAVNFDNKPAKLRINIPQHAFDILGIPEGDCVATELLSGRREPRRISPDTPFEASIEGYGAVIWKVSHKNLRGKAKKVSANGTATRKKA